MYSGKSTELLRRVRRALAINNSVCLVNHALDTRYESNTVSTHNGCNMKSFKYSSLKELDTAVNIVNEYNLIAIDEGQFFKDLEEYVKKFVEEYNLHVVIAGLIGDFKREKFGHMLDLIPFATDIIHTKALCDGCKNGKEAVFTVKIHGESTQIDIGSIDKYKAVCRACYKNY